MSRTGFWELGAVVENFGFFEQQDRSLAQQPTPAWSPVTYARKFHEFPAGITGDQQVLWLTHRGTYSAQRGADGSMHTDCAESDENLLTPVR